MMESILSRMDTTNQEHTARARIGRLAIPVPAALIHRTVELGGCGRLVIGLDARIRKGNERRPLIKEIL